MCLDIKTKGESIAEAYIEIDSTGVLLSHYSQLSADLEKMHQLSERDKKFKKGTNDAATIVGVMYGMLKPDDPDPILAKARKNYNKKEHQLPLSFPGPKPENGDPVLAAIVANLTIFEYIKKNIKKFS